MTISTIDSNTSLEDRNNNNDDATHELLEDNSPDSTSAITDEHSEEIKQARLAKRQESMQLANKLSEHYPAIFPKTGLGRPVALAIGLHKELLPIVQSWGHSAVTLRSVLAWYTRQLRYQRALLFSECRVNLDGSQAEPITEEQKSLAKENIEKIESWLAENKPDKIKKMNERKARVIEQKKKPTQNFASKKKKTSTPSVKQREPEKIKHSPTSNTSSHQTMDEKIQGLMSKFNQ